MKNLSKNTIASFQALPVCGR